MLWIKRPIWKRVASNIKTTREWKGFSQEEVSLRSGIDLKSLKRIERGVTNDLTLEQTFRIICALKCEVEEIIPMLNPKYLKLEYITSQ